jgi:hypothetical protein
MEQAIEGKERNEEETHSSTTRRELDWSQRSRSLHFMSVRSIIEQKV